MSVANIPLKLKSLASYLKTANEIEKRDPVVAYYCRLYAVQRGMELDRSSQESKKYLMELMDNLDSMKKSMKDNESIISETVGQAHVEEYALRLFSYADKKDREGDFEQATIRSFITAGFLMDVLSVFGDVGEDIEKCRKYAKWKAVYISQCLKNGETPHAGPIEDPDENIGGIDNFPAKVNQPNPVIPANSTAATPSQPTPTPRTQKPATGATNTSKPTSNAGGGTFNEATSSYYPETNTAVSNSLLTPEDFAQAEKMCKYAASALQYQDATTAIDYLSKCINLLKTGKK